MKSMTQQRHLKSLIEEGQYQLQPELVAAAMLRRRGVRTLLTGAAISPAGRIPSAPAARRQAA
jgi:urease accessory protein UreE